MIATILISAGLTYFLSLPFASVLQGGGYRLKALLRAKKELLACALYFSFVAAVESVVILRFPFVLVCVWTSVFYLFTGAFVFLVHRKMRIDMHYTPRLVRLLIATTALYIVGFIGLFFLSFNGLWAATPALAPFLLIFAALLTRPVEKANNRRYIDKARAALSQTSATKIGVTGSYGKTSVKHYLEGLLSAKYFTLVSPENYNTPLGIARTMREATGREEMLVLEMGARRRGDIGELCDIVRPDVGVITGIAPQHLETFLSVENILAEKNVLAESVGEDGVVFYNLTDSSVRTLYDKRRGKRVGVGFENADYLIRNVGFSALGATFSLVKGDKSLRMTSSCVGMAFVVNFCLAAAVAIELGVPWETVASAAMRAYPPPHRFEVVRSGDVVVVDDSYNVNPVGAAAALDSLGCFNAERKIVYTSGMVELGDEEERLNRALGKRISEVASVAVVCEGRYGDAVVRGISDDVVLFRAKDTAAASKLFESILKKGDVLLIMSDLPRDYLL